MCTVNITNNLKNIKSSTAPAGFTSGQLSSRALWPMNFTWIYFLAVRNICPSLEEARKKKQKNCPTRPRAD